MDIQSRKINYSFKFQSILYNCIYIYIIHIIASFKFKYFVILYAPKIEHQFWDSKPIEMHCPTPWNAAQWMPGELGWPSLLVVTWNITKRSSKFGADIWSVTINQHYLASSSSHTYHSLDRIWFKPSESWDLDEDIGPLRTTTFRRSTFCW